MKTVTRKPPAIITLETTAPNGWPIEAELTSRGIVSAEGMLPRFTCITIVLWAGKRRSAALVARQVKRLGYTTRIRRPRKAVRLEGLLT